MVANQLYCWCFKLPDAYVIFITEDDYYKANKPLYLVQRMNVTLNQPFNDGTHILYVNSLYQDDSALGRLMHDFNCSNPDDMYYEILQIRHVTSRRARKE